MKLQNFQMTRKQYKQKQFKKRLVQHDTGAMCAMMIGMWLVLSFFVALSTLGMPTGYGKLFGIITGIVLVTLVMGLIALIFALVLAWIKLPLPSMTISSFLYVLTLLTIIANESKLATVQAILFALMLTLFGAVLGLVVWSIMHFWHMLPVKIGSLIIVLVGSGVLFSLFNGSTVNQTVLHQDVSSVKQLSTDPSQPGDYPVKFFSYGSGVDRHQAVYGKEVDMISHPVDGAHYVSSLSKNREDYWGFDAEHLPLNARVWMPEGEGPFPLVLMVHGNHSMEYASDKGYGYLGKMLASQGIIAISVAENFLNYSTWSTMPNDDYMLRAWMLLKHIQQIQGFATEKGNPFYQKVDFDQIGLLGHSRGGEAVAMATDRSRWYQDDDHLPDPDSYTIRGVVALAPTDIFVDDQKAHLKDVNYLVLQGREDADVHHFYGARQYERTSFTPGSNHFKATLSIAHANHVHFNTGWGNYDLSLPRGIFLDLRDLIPAQDQRKIAKIYVGAFFQTTFFDKQDYLPLFRDYRAGLNLLPKTNYLNRFTDSHYIPLVQFATNVHQEHFADGVTGKATKLIQSNYSGRGSGRELKWKNNGTYTLSRSEKAIFPVLAQTKQGANAYLSLTMANQSTNMADIKVKIADENGHSSIVSLQDLQPVRPVTPTTYTWSHKLAPYVYDGKFDRTPDPLFQTYTIPLQEFRDKGLASPITSWTLMELQFDHGPGDVIIKNIGISH